MYYETNMQEASQSSLTMQVASTSMANLPSHCAGDTGWAHWLPPPLRHNILFAYKLPYVGSNLTAVILGTNGQYSGSHTAADVTTVVLYPPTSPMRYLSEPHGILVSPLSWALVR